MDQRRTGLTVLEAQADRPVGVETRREVQVATESIEVNVEASAGTDTEIRKTNAETEVEAEVVIEADIVTKTSETRTVKVTIKAAIAKG